MCGFCKAKLQTHLDVLQMAKVSWHKYQFYRSLMQFVSQDMLKLSVNRQKTNTLTFYTAQKTFHIPIKITTLLHYEK